MPCSPLMVPPRAMAPANIFSAACVRASFPLGHAHRQDSRMQISVTGMAENADIHLIFSADTIYLLQHFS